MWERIPDSLTSGSSEVSTGGVHQSGLEGTSLSGDLEGDSGRDGRDA